MKGDKMKHKKKYIVGIITLVVIFFYFVTIKPEQDRKKTSMEQYSKGYGAFNSGKYREAINSFKHALIIGLDEYFAFQAYEQIGRAHGLLGEYEQALKAFNKALNAPIPEPYDSISWSRIFFAGVHYHMGNLHFDEKKYTEAISEYNMVIQMNSTRSDCYSQIGKAYANLGLREQAIRHCKMGIEKRPDAHFAYKALGDVYSVFKEYKLALDLYNKCLTMLENSKPIPELAAIYKPDLYICLGSSYQNLNDMRQAIDAYKSAIKENNETPYAYYELARIYLYQGDKQAAMELYQNLKELDNALSVELLDEIHKVGVR